MKLNHLYKFSVLGMLILILSSCANGNAEASKSSQEEAAPFQVATVPKKTVTAYTTYPTTIEGVINSEVRAKVSGYIQKVLVDEGEKVRKGQRLFQLETQTLSQDAAAAKANVNAAQVEVDKLIPLVEKNIISNVQLETAKAKLAQAKAGYNSVSATINYGTIKSPVDGFVGAIPYREGSLVSATSAKPLTTVSDIAKVYAYFSMNETDYLDFLQNTDGENLQKKIENFPNVELLLANGQTFQQQGTLETVTGQIDPNTGTVSFRAVFDNPNQLITNGNSGTIKVPIVYENAFVIPQSATYEQQGQVFVYKVSEDNKAVQSLIEISDKTSNLYVLKSGIEEGDKIVVKGITKLRNNTPIQPQEVPFDSIAKPVKTLFK
ncbi:efflux RND transporter periplasmic adaptor subunit [Cochleicola gelatinilyticus]|uniref:Efflux transporter periplasmic adaptor subunit n=1 Tax=Cochleicola gelatinilyticus TaxID=1763537 RepID=A0A167HJ74_9FLAO|nr:efflux RND transporter periplasmic adaptor subunit [Cochleicola gelatinilyticus]OAB78667.1 efflux transporter periplasmic adaptor subunit [Cochleicola gelatinilyticus]